jgi:hypothetical protein
MAPSSRDRISVDLRGLKAELVEQARARGVSPSDLVRAALADALDHAKPPIADRPAFDTKVPSEDRVRLSLRMSRRDALATVAAAHAAGLSRGTYVASLVAGVPVLMSGTSRADQLAALIASNAELSTLRRNLERLTSLLSQGSVRAAQEYRAMLDTVAQDVRIHLALTSAALVDLRPHRSRSSKVPDHRT